MRLIAFAVVSIHAAVAYADSQCLGPPLVPHAIDGDRLVLCAGEGRPCWAVTEGGTPTRTSPVPEVLPSAPPAAEIRDVDGKPAACLGDTCKPLGPRAAEAVATARAGGNGSLSATADLAVAIVDGAPWSIARDRIIALSAPRGADQGAKGVAEPLGRWLIGSWASCGGSCTVSTVLDADGHAHGKPFAGGSAVTIDDHRVAIVPADRSDRPAVTLIQLGTAKQLGSVTIAGKLLNQVRADRDTIVVFTSDPDDDWTQTAVWIHVPAGKPPKLGGHAVLRYCD